MLVELVRYTDAGAVRIETISSIPTSHIQQMIARPPIALPVRTKAMLDEQWPDVHNAILLRFDRWCSCDDSIKLVIKNVIGIELETPIYVCHIDGKETRICTAVVDASLGTDWRQFSDDVIFYCNVIDTYSNVVVNTGLPWPTLIDKHDNVYVYKVDMERRPSEYYEVMT